MNLAQENHIHMLKDNFKLYSNKKRNGLIMEATNTGPHRALPLVDLTN